MASTPSGLRSKNLLRKFYFKNKNSVQNFNPPSDAEVNQTIVDLRTITSLSNYKPELTGDYVIYIIDDKISLKAAERTALEKAVDENTSEASYKLKNPKGERKIKIYPRFSEIIMNTRSLIYVPKWIITIKAGGVSYNRTILAASKTFIVDEIADCPKLHFSLGKLWTIRKKTYAIW